MSSSFALATTLALLLPLGLGSGASDADEVRGVPMVSAPQCVSPDIGSASHSDPVAPALPLAIPSEVSGANPLQALYNANTAHQVRIERRVTIRISPYRQGNRNSLLARLPRQGLPATFEERKMDNCVPVSGIAGVQTGNGNRLLLFLNDQRIVSLNLARGCRARDFYSGFYVERNDDGRLCVKRDQLQSRSGAKCQVAGMRRLVPVSE
ncbi:hypothetical protein INR77_11405 [Erythrobacter sp. SCSIO 43205]|uniref:hypothetical protein n=1 Tax=Erythrobacter sp. SCSIO 43205 TaxID=2779361 RepID=UPI001CA8C31B|nr:hypothetical protein [Erythrobacter sp. SCSIO 43205]UAB77407.1 hypothetical protein INR77_11405 [Erythrobacter sp. SCSIO 43205]